MAEATEVRTALGALEQPAVDTIYPGATVADDANVVDAPSIGVIASLSAETLDLLEAAIQHRRKILAGAKLCPSCGEILAPRHPHVHDGTLYAVPPSKPKAKAAKATKTAETPA